MEEIKRITIIGSGNVATHLARLFFQNGIEIPQVFSRNLANANRLAEQVNSQAINNLEYVEDGADLYLFCLKDDAYNDLIAQWPLQNKNMAHSSGSLEGAIFEKKTKAFGVFYPYQSFSLNQEVDFKNLPFFVNSPNTDFFHQLTSLGKKLDIRIVQLDHHQRKIYHLAAVFANNFVNRLYHIAEQICENEDLDFDLMRPLIAETANKVMTNLPSDMQTGPAKRVDLGVLNVHYSSLAGDPDKQKVYQILSESIIKAQKDHE